jgi:LytS/YehU family sensor histidine kinase
MEPETLGIGIPHMALQGLVENAIKHGMRAHHAHFAINVRARMEGDALTIEVDNPGELRAPFDLARAGVGLTNLCQRLALRYPGRHSFALEQNGGRTVATLRLQGDPAIV